ncbi:MAG TPA: 16S rRNA (guanine(527)-N(7))-methyltransferase RsmG [Ruminococcaceae bacterium]|nr:16S rRNA (guanine(527)-N(7))-methyltransferase RsmG [Oscillospiraceae bacterium]
MAVIDRGLLKEKAAQLDVVLEDTALDRFELMAALMVEWNEKINLTAITQPNEIVIKHFIDSLTAAWLLPEGAFSLIDVGTGAGFPGVPLAIVRPDSKLTLLDSLNKRLVYLKELCRALEIEAELVHARAEDAGQKREMRERFDVVTARAVATLPVLCEYCLPLVKVGGKFIAMKGPEGEAEAKASENAVKRLGGQMSAIEKCQIQAADTNIERRLIVFDKISITPPKYPRNAAKIKKQPL